MTSGLTQAFSDYSRSVAMSRVQYAIARKVLDSQQQAGQAIVGMIRSAGEVASKAGDSLVAQATGLGGLIDTRG
jgi:hypothetical protein